jgi:hypothetical protein
MSFDISLQRLASTLKAGTDDLKGLDGLTPEQVDELNTILVNALHQQHEAMKAAIDRGLDHVPSLLRGAVKKIVRG